MSTCSPVNTARHFDDDYFGKISEIEANVIQLSRDKKCAEMWEYLFPLAAEDSPEAARMLMVAIDAFNTETYPVQLMYPPFDRVMWSELERALLIVAMGFEDFNGSGFHRETKRFITSGINLANRNMQYFNLPELDECKPASFDKYKCQASLKETGTFKTISDFKDEYETAKTQNIKAGCFKFRRPFP